MDMYPKCTRFVPAPVLPGMGGVLPDKKKLCKIAIFRQIYWAILGCVGSSPTSGAIFYPIRQVSVIFAAELLP